VEQSLEQRDLCGPLAKQLRDALSFFDRHVRKVQRLESGERRLDPEYPPNVVREAIVNALVHRDYQTGSHVFFQMFRDRILVRSPGGPVEPLTIDMFPFDVRVPTARNPKIAQAAYEFGLMESRGYGVRNMPQRLREWGLRDPQFAVDQGFFVVTLFGREVTPLRTRLTPEELAGLNTRQLRLLDVLDRKRVITSPEWAKLAPATRQTAKKDLDLFEKMGIVVRQGSGNMTSYRVR
jgi:ATP-dependent DNA helicase RecG